MLKDQTFRTTKNCPDSLKQVLPLWTRYQFFFGWSVIGGSSFIVDIEIHSWYWPFLHLQIILIFIWYTAEKLQGGQNVQIASFFLALKLYGFFSSNCSGFIREIHLFLFDSFQQILHENFQKKSCKKEVILTYFLHSK